MIGPAMTKARSLTTKAGPAEEKAGPAEGKPRAATTKARAETVFPGPKRVFPGPKRVFPAAKMVFSGLGRTIPRGRTVFLGEFAAFTRPTGSERPGVGADVGGRARLWDARPAVGG